MNTSLLERSCPACTQKMFWLDPEGFCVDCILILQTKFYYHDQIDEIPHYSRYLSFPLVYSCLKSWKKNQGQLLNPIILSHWKSMLLAIQYKINTDECILVPMPHESALKKCTSLLAENASKQFKIPTVDLLERNAGWHKQATQGHFERMKKESVYRLKYSFGDFQNIYLIDDFCTTRNTLLGAKKILESHGARIKGFLTLSTTPLKFQSDLQKSLVPLQDLSFPSKEESFLEKRF